MKYGRHVETGEEVAVKIMRKDRVLGPEAEAMATTTKKKSDDGGGNANANANANNAAAPPPSASRSRLTREIAILRRLRHPNLVVLKDVLASKDKVYVVMEFVAGGELFDRVAAEGPLPEGEARRMFQQLADALAHCHSAGVFHRDLKPENVLLTRQGDVKLSDFGFGHLSISKRGGGGGGGGVGGDKNSENDDFMLSTACGTPAFVAPEVLARKGYEGGPADVWSLGVTLAVMLSGRLPFDEPSLPRLFRRIAAADFSLPAWVPPGGADLVSAILKPDPRDRPTLERIFEHPWVRPGLKRAFVSGGAAGRSGWWSSSSSKLLGGGGGSTGGSSGTSNSTSKKREKTPLSPRSASSAADKEEEEDPFSDSVPPVAERNLDAAEAAEASVRGGVAGGASGGASGGGANSNNRPAPMGTVKMNAFTLLSAALDLSGLLAEREGSVRRHTRFTTRCSLGQVHACLARAAEAVGGRAFGGGVAALEALSSAEGVSSASPSSPARPLPAFAWRARLELPVSVSVASRSVSSSGEKNEGENERDENRNQHHHRAPSPLRLFVSARVDISPLLPGTLVVDVTRAGGSAAADFYQAYGPFEAAVLEELAAAKEKEKREKEEKEGGKEAAAPLLPSPSPPPQPPLLPPLAPSPSPPSAAAAARSSGAATPESTITTNDAASVVGARAQGSLLASSTLAFSAGERGGGGGVVGGGVPRVSSVRSLRSAGSGRGQAAPPPKRSGREDFWDDDGSSGDDFDAFDNDDDDVDGNSDFGNEEEEVAAVARLVLD